MNMPATWNEPAWARTTPFIGSRPVSAQPRCKRSGLTGSNTLRCSASKTPTTASIAGTGTARSRGPAAIAIAPNASKIACGNTVNRSWRHSAGACPWTALWSNTTGNHRATEPNKMNTTHHPLRADQTQSWLVSVVFAVLNFLLAFTLSAGEGPTDKSGAGAGQLVPLELKLPPPAFKGTPKDMQLS